MSGVRVCASAQASAVHMIWPDMVSRGCCVDGRTEAPRCSAFFIFVIILIQPCHGFGIFHTIFSFSDQNRTFYLQAQQKLPIEQRTKQAA